MIQKAYAVDISKDFLPARSFGDIGSILNLFIPLAMTGAAMLGLIMLLWGAYTFLTAGGESENIDKAKKIFTFTIVGFVIIVISYLLVKLIGRILNIDFII